MSGKITVLWSGVFPVDMLRFERAFPVTNFDSAEIESSIIDGTGKHKADIYLTNNNVNPKRWHSFNCKVFIDGEEITEATPLHD